MNAPDLVAFGWTGDVSTAFTAHAAAGLEPGRVVAEDRGSYIVQTAGGERRASVTGRYRFDAGNDPAAYPAVGDWVALEARDDGASVHAVLPRRTSVLRHAPGLRSVAQVVAANVDVVFVVASLNQDLNLRRLERYLALAWESGAEPVVVLSKADLGEDLDATLAEVESIAVGVTIIVVSAIDGRGIDELRGHIRPGATVAFVGSSGVGKSSLINALLDQAAQSVRSIRGDGKGRHTTTSRRLILLPGGGVVIDTPGLRELALWNADAGLGGAFADIESLASECAFRDCRHVTEAGCAVRDAMESGTLAEARVGSYRKLHRELEYVAGKQDESVRIAGKNRWKTLAKQHRQREKVRAKYGRLM